MIDNEELRIPFLRCAYNSIFSRLDEDREEEIIDAYYNYQSEWSWEEELSEHAQFMEQGSPLPVAERELIVEAVEECLEPATVSMMLPNAADFVCFSGLTTEDHISLAKRAFRFVLFPDYPNMSAMIRIARDVCSNEMITQTETSVGERVRLQLDGLGLSEDTQSCVVEEYARLLIEDIERLYSSETETAVEAHIGKILEECAQKQSP